MAVMTSLHQIAKLPWDQSFILVATARAFRLVGAHGASMKNLNSCWRDACKQYLRQLLSSFAVSKQPRKSGPIMLELKFSIVQSISMLGSCARD